MTKQGCESHANKNKFLNSFHIVLVETIPCHFFYIFRLTNVKSEMCYKIITPT